MTTITPTCVDALRAALVQTITCSSQELQDAIGQVIVATAAELPETVAPGSAERSVYDSHSRTTVLLADRIPAGLESQAITGEIVRQHGRRVAESVLGEMGKQTPLEAGDKVFVLSDQRLATVLNVYGDGLNGSYGEVRVDLCGNTPIDNLEPYDAVKHALYDESFLPIKAEWKESYGITKDVPLRPADDKEVDQLVDPLIVVELRAPGGETEVVELNASEVLRYKRESRTWDEIGRDPAHLHAQGSWAADYALNVFKRQFGDLGKYEVTVISGLTGLGYGSGDVQPSSFVEAAQFHSMRGHVADGTRIRFGSGEMLTVHSAMKGWVLESDDGKVSMGPFDGAHALTAAVVRRDASSIESSGPDYSASPTF